MSVEINFDDPNHPDERERRLTRLFAAAMLMRRLLPLIKTIGCHKGGLDVLWEERPSADQVETVESIWVAANENRVRQRFNDEIIKDSW